MALAAFLNLPLALVCGVFLLMPQSRTALFAFATCLLVVFILFRRRRGMAPRPWWRRR